MHKVDMLDQDLLSKNGLSDVQQAPPHLASYSQFQQYQQTMAGYNNMGYGFPAAMYTQNGYGYSLAGYPHAPSPSSDGRYSIAGRQRWCSRRRPRSSIARLHGDNIGLIFTLYFIATNRLVSVYTET